MNISINLGNFWDAISAISTTAAVIFSLWLVRHDEKINLQVLVGSQLEIQNDEHGMKIFSGGENIIQTRIYNAGKKSAAVSFIGYCVGEVEKSKFKTLFHRKREFKQIIAKPDSIFESPKLEFIKPGESSDIKEIGSKYAYNLGKEFYEKDGTLKVYAVFEDVYSKRYIAYIEIKK